MRWQRRWVQRDPALLQAFVHSFQLRGVLLRELDCEIKERELKLAEHLKDLELREAAVTQRKRDIAAELQYELGLELEKVRAHEEEVRRRKDALDAEVKQREDALARREILVAEREWTLKAKEDAPKGVMGKVFENLEALGKENDKNVQTNRTHLDNTSTSGMPLFVENALFVGDGRRGGGQDVRSLHGGPSVLHHRDPFHSDAPLAHASVGLSFRQATKPL